MKRHLHSFSLLFSELRQNRDKIESDLRNKVLAVEPAEKKELRRFRSIQIKSLYENIDGRMVRPIKAVFNRLPAIQLLESLERETAEHLIENGEFMKMVNDNLSAWIKDTKDRFGKLLGHERWISISSKTFHPADRADAFFQCKKCHRVPTADTVYGALTFQKACLHLCQGLSKLQREKAEWCVSDFEVDQKVWSIKTPVIVVVNFPHSGGTCRPESIEDGLM